MTWLESLSLTEYYKNFTNDGYDDLEVISSIEKEDELKDLGYVSIVSPPPHTHTLPIIYIHICHKNNQPKPRKITYLKSLCSGTALSARLVLFRTILGRTFHKFINQLSVRIFIQNEWR